MQRNEGKDSSMADPSKPEVPVDSVGAESLRAAKVAMALPDAAGFILAGGKSSRMGTDKALALFRGQPLIANALAILREAGLIAAISGTRPDLSAYAEDIPDTFTDVGPLGGVHAALSSSMVKEWNVFLPVDMPLMSPVLLRQMIGKGKSTGSPVIACSLNGTFQPFPVVLHRKVLQHIEQRLREGKTACFHAWRVIPMTMGSIIHVVPVESGLRHRCCGPPVDVARPDWFESANTPAELARLNEIFSGDRRDLI